MRTSALLAAMAVAMAITPAARGQFMFISTLPGEVTEQGKEDSHELSLYSHAVQIPIDTQTGQATGVRRHAPITIKKKVNKSTPNIYKACTNGEMIPSVEFRFYRFDPTGGEVEYFRITLEEVHIVAFSTEPTGPDDTFTTPAEAPLQESLTLTYRRITWNWVAGGIEHTDDWVVARKSDDPADATDVERASTTEGTFVRILSRMGNPVSATGPDGKPAVLTAANDGTLVQVTDPGFYSYRFDDNSAGHFFAR